MKENTNTLKPNTKGNTDSPKNQVYPHNSPPKNPYDFNGELIENQQLTSENPSNRKLYIESYGCS